MPSALQFTEGHTSEYLYDAAGVKRKVKQVTTTGNLMVPMGSMLPVPADKVTVTTQTDYCGNVIYENGTLSRILVDGGYITMSGTTPTYHYYFRITKEITVWYSIRTGQLNKPIITIRSE